jgi:hypothetical protein
LRLGVRWVDLDLSMRTRDTVNARLVAASIARLVAPVTGAPLAARVESASRVLNADGVPRDLTKSIRSASDSAWFDLGVWLETARLAARAGTTGFFADGSAARRQLPAVLDAIGRTDFAARPPVPEVVARLQALVAAVDDRTSRDALAAALGRVIEELAR